MTVAWDDPQDILARTIYGEARSEGRKGMEAVACVILNRAKQPAWWGKDVCGVCLHPWQFSCWNEGDPNRLIITGVGQSDLSFHLATAIAKNALGGWLDDPTGGADHYFNWHTKKPKWAEGVEPSSTIGSHAFYKLGPAA